jgi:hypothetical protein
VGGECEGGVAGSGDAWVVMRAGSADTDGSGGEREGKSL